MSLRVCEQLDRERRVLTVVLLTGEGLPLRRCLQDRGKLGGGVVRAIADSCLEVTSSIELCTSTKLNSAAMDSSKESSPRGKSCCGGSFEEPVDAPPFENLQSDALTHAHVSETLPPKTELESDSSLRGCDVLADADFFLL